MDNQDSKNRFLFTFSKSDVFAILGVILIVVLMLFIGKPSSTASTTGSVINSGGSQEISTIEDGKASKQQIANVVPQKGGSCGMSGGSCGGGGGGCGGCGGGCGG